MQLQSVLRLHRQRLGVWHRWLHGLFPLRHARDLLPSLATERAEGGSLDLIALQTRAEREDGFDTHPRGASPTHCSVQVSTGALAHATHLRTKPPSSTPIREAFSRRSNVSFRSRLISDGLSPPPHADMQSRSIHGGPRDDHRSSEMNRCKGACQWESGPG